MVRHGSSELSEYLKLLRELMRLLTQAMVKQVKPPALDSPTVFYERTSYNGDVTEMPFITLRTKGCSWKLRSGGCTMCGYTLDSSLGKPVPDGMLLAQIRKGLREAEALHPQMLAITPAGSFFDDEELPPCIRSRIAESVSGMDSVRVLYVESRPEFIVKAAESGELEQLSNKLKGVRLSVGIGLESSDDFVRNYIVHKGVSLKLVSRALRALREHAAYTVLYVLLKPAFLSEGEAIRDAINSVKWATEHADRVVLFPLRVYPYTLNWLLLRRGEYRPPWLWSVLEVIRALSKDELRKLVVTGWQTPPLTGWQARNCDLCTDKVKGLLLA